jgi:AcrR family transcriptional regulator
MRVKRSAKPSKPLAWRRRAERRSRAIRAAARALLEQHGHRGTSIARIARRAGVSEATIYAHFRSREALLDRVLTEWATPFIEGLERDLVGMSGLRTKVEHIARSHLRSLHTNPRVHRAFLEEILGDGRRDTPLHRLDQRCSSMLVEAVREAVAAGEAAPSTDPAALCDLLFGGLEHSARRTLFTGRAADVDAHAASLARLILDGAAHRSPPGTAHPRRIPRRATARARRMAVSLPRRLASGTRSKRSRQP